MHILIHDSTKTHYLSLGQTELLANACDSGREVNKIPGIGRAALRKLVDSRASGKHGTAKTFFLILTECHRQLSNLVNGTLTEVIAKRHGNLISGINEFLDGSF